MTKNKSIVLNSGELPTYKQLAESVGRLMKDYRLLQRIRGNSDTEDPESFKSVASFLESFMKREKRNLPKDSESTESMESLINAAADYLNSMDDWELKQTVEETRLKKILDRVRP